MQNVEVNEGAAGYFEIRVAGEPQVVWAKDGDPIRPSDKVSDPIRPSDKVSDPIRPSDKVSVPLIQLEETTGKTCNLCGKLCLTPIGLLEHVATCHKCDYCKETVENLADNVKEAHQVKICMHGNNEFTP